MDTTDEMLEGTKTFRGRSLDEVLPNIRAELGADAIVLRRREGLAGGVGGFFQKSYVEVEARAALSDELPLEARNDRATVEGLASPAIQALVSQAAPFADALSRAEGSVGERAQEVLLAAASGATAAPVAAGLYGPQPNHAAIEDVVHDDLDLEFEIADPAPAPTPARETGASAGAGVPRPRTADAAEQRLVAAGFSAGLAADLVGEAVAHGLPFADPRALKKLVRGALARRLLVLSDLGPGARTLAFVGAGGSGKSTATERLAAAYADADADVVVVALRSPDGGTALASRLEPLGVSVIAADDAEQAMRRLAHREAVLTIVDAPAAGPADRKAVGRLSADLRTLGVSEVHLTLPATISAAAAEELVAALAPIGITHLALTHTDQTARPGAPVELSVISGRELSYVCSRDAIEPADAAALAKQLLP